MAQASQLCHHETCLALDELHGADGTQEEDGGHLDPWDHGRNLGEMLQDLNGL